MLTNRIDLRSYHAESCSHAHDFAQLVLPISGSMALEAGHYAGVVNSDIGIYIAPQEQHCFSGNQENLFLVIDMTATNFFSDEGSKSHKLNLTDTTKKLIQFTHHYLTHHERDFFTDFLVNQLLDHFVATPCTPRQDSVVIKARYWIDNHFTSPVDISKVAAYCHMSISQLQRRFKTILGCSLAEYWRMKKLHHSKKLLSHKNCSIEAIAFEVGYENLPAFSRRFSKVFGQSPSQWRRKAFTAKNMRETDN